MTPQMPASPIAFIARVVALAAIAIVIIPSNSVRAKDTDPVVATVSGQEVRESDIALAEQVIGRDLPEDLSPEQRRQSLITYVTDMLVMAKAAEARKISKDPGFARRMEFERNRALMDMLLQSVADKAATKRAMRRAYRTVVRRMTNLAEMRARHVLVETEDEAKAIAAEIRKGGDIAEIAKAKSKDQGSASEGGDLGYFTRDQVDAAFAKAAFRLKPGQVSRPVKTDLGWHVIKVEDRRFKEVPTYEQMEGDLRLYVARKAQADLIASLRRKAKIKLVDLPADGKKN